MEHEDEKELEKLKKERRKAEGKERFREVANLSNCIGVILAKYEQYEDAISEHEMEKVISEKLQDVMGEGVACRKIGECYSSLGEYKKALRLHFRYLHLARSCDNIVEEQRALATIGNTYLESIPSSDTREEVSKKAEDVLKECLELTEKVKCVVEVREYMDMKARAFLNLGLVYDNRGEVKRGVEYVKRAITISEKYNLYETVYFCQFDLFGVYQRSGNVSQALRALDEAQKNARKLKDKLKESETLLQKAQVMLIIGDYESVKHSVKLAKKLGFPQQKHVETFYKLYKTVESVKKFNDDLEMADDNTSRLQIYDSLADLYYDSGMLKKALEYYHKQLQCAVDIGLNEKELAKIYVSLAATYHDNKDYSEALKYYKLELTCHTDNQKEICETLRHIAIAEENLKMGYSKLSKSYLAAFEAARKIKHRTLQVKVLKSLAEIQKRFKQNNHLATTQAKLQNILNKHGVEVDELSDEESQATEDEVAIVISDISESEDEDDEEIPDISSTIRCSTRKTAKLKTKRNEKGETPLHRACIDGKFEKVKKLIEQGHPVNPRDNCGWIPLHEAANHDFYQIVEFLVDHGADINDRGGTHCGGVTPLIDAASCGNMETMDLLINRGANVLAKNDEHQTALDCLIEWRERCDDTLNQDLDIQYTNTLHLLQQCSTTGTAKMKSLIRKTTISPVDLYNQYSDEEDLLELSFSKKTKRQKDLLALKKTPKALIAEDDEEDSGPVDSYDSQEVYRSAILDDLETSHQSATEDYRKAISLVGTSAHRLASQIPKSSQKRRTSEPTADQVALISADCHVGDDWLIDDVGPIKRKFRDYDGFMSGITSRNENSSTTKRQRITVEADFSDFSDFGENNVNFFDDNLVHIDDSSPEILPNSSKNKSHSSLSLQRKPKQTRITSFGASSERRETTLSSTRENGRNLRTFCSNSKQNGVNSRNIVLSDSDSSNSVEVASAVFGTHRTSASASTPSASLVMRLKVRLKDKTLLIPVSNSDQNNTMSWLAQQVSQRYFSLYGLRPLLTLSTTEGAIFSPDDIVSMVLVNNDELQGSVESWDLPPLHQRYKQACKTLTTVFYGNVSNILQTSETTGHLELRDLALRPTQLQPIIRALQGQSNLTVLNLQGNRIGDTGVENLSKIFESMCNLTSLNLACNNISSIGVKHLVDGLHPINNTPKYLQMLSCLNLQNNALGDTCITSLSDIISNLPLLTSLNLSTCHLTSKCFQNHRILLANSLSGSNIQVLDVSCNKFGSLGIELFIKCLNSKKIISLNMADTQSGTNISHLSLHFQQYVTQVGCTLEDLNISGCNLSSDDIHFITRLPSSCPKLHRLSICNNLRINNRTLEELLQQIVVNNDSSLDELIVNGCSIKSPLDTPFLDGISDSLCRNMPLRYFSFTCENIEKVDSDCVRQVWQDKWQDLSKISVTGNHIQLRVSEGTS